MKTVEINANTIIPIKYKSINKIIICSMLIILLLDFLSINKYFIHILLVIPVFFTLIKLMRMRQFKRQSLAYFRAWRNPIFKDIIFIIIVFSIVFLLRPYLGILDKHYNLIMTLFSIEFLPTLFFSVFIRSIVTYENGIHINVRKDDIIPWKNVENIEVNGKYVIIQINGKFEKYIYHKKDIDDLNVLIKQFSDHNEKYNKRNNDTNMEI